MFASIFPMRFIFDGVSMGTFDSAEVAPSSDAISDFNV